MSCHRPRTFLFALCLPAIFAAAAQAAIPANIKTSATPAAFSSQIKGSINTQVKLLSSANPFEQSAARKALIEECDNKVGGPSSPQFLAEYAGDVAKALQPLVKPANTIHMRVNAGVVAAEVAGRVYRGDGDVASMTPLIQALLADKQTAVVLWGMKAAKYDLGSAIQNSVPPGPISKAVVKSLKDHLDSGVVVEEAYNALTLDHLDKLKGDAQFAVMVAPLLPDLLDLIALRAQQFRNGAMPPSPQAERVVTVFLSVTAYPAVAANPAILNRTLKVMGDLTCGAVRAVAGGNNAPELFDMAKETGRFFETIGTQMQNQGVQAAGKNISNMGINTDPAMMGTYCDGLASTLKDIGVTIDAGGGAGNAAEQPAQPAIAGSSK